MAKKKNLSAKAVKLLQKVRDTILTDPDKFDMGQWGVRYDKTALGYEQLAEANSCGTVGCIAGWICVLGDKKIDQKLTIEAKKRTKRNQKSYGDMPFEPVDVVGAAGISEQISSDVPDYAALLLGVDYGDTDIYSLFYVGRWPLKFQAMWENNVSNKKRAKIAAKVIDSFIKHDGVWVGTLL